MVSKEANKSSLSVVCFKWDAEPERSKSKPYHAGHVNALKQMVSDNLEMAHSFYCVTDNRAGLDCDIQEIELPPSLGDLSWRFPKLMIFSQEARKIFGERLLYLDLDAVVTGSLDPLIPERDTEFMILSKPLVFSFWELLGSVKRRRQRALYDSGVKYNSSFMYMRTGLRSRVYDEFTEKKALRVTSHHMVGGSDQVWIYSCLGGREKTWTKQHGVYSYCSDLTGKRAARVPSDARLIFFGGGRKPWESEVLSASPWIAKYYPLDRLEDCS